MQISLMFLYLIFGRYYLFRKILPLSEDITFIGVYSILPYFISTPSLSYCLRLPVGGSVSVMRTTAVRDRERVMLWSKASMCWGRKRSQISRRPWIFSASSVTISALPNAMADLNCRVKLPSFGPTVGAQRVTAERQTSGWALIASSFLPSRAPWKYQFTSSSDASERGKP